MTGSPCPDVADLPAATEAVVVAFPHAGGSGAAYRGWQRALGPRIALLAVTHPGHTGRFTEPLLETCEELADEVAPRLTARPGLPLVLFGHSMGSLVAFEVARRLEQRYGISPAHLFVSGSPGPGRPARATASYRLPDDRLIGWLEEMGGCDEAIARDRELMAFLLPVLRADLRFGESYRPWTGSGVSCPVTALTGAQDPSVTPAENLAWQEATGAAFRQHIFPGGHFYLHEDAAHDVVATVRRTAEDSYRLPTEHKELTS